jgi:hypothetical protein
MPSSKRTLCIEPQAASLTRASYATAAQTFKFNGPVIQRYGYEIAAIFAIKLPLLLLLWFVVIRPWPHDPAVAADSVARSYSVTSQVAPHGD